MRLMVNFVSAACWIQGVYVYKQLVEGGPNKKILGYFGMPKNMDHEGMIEGSAELCNLKPKLGVPASPKCKAMTKTFFLQVNPFIILFYFIFILFYFYFIFIFCILYI